MSNTINYLDVQKENIINIIHRYVLGQCFYDDEHTHTDIEKIALKSSYEFAVTGDENPEKKSMYSNILYYDEGQDDKETLLNKTMSFGRMLYDDDRLADKALGNFFSEMHEDMDDYIKDKSAYKFALEVLLPPKLVNHYINDYKKNNETINEDKLVTFLSDKLCVKEDIIQKVIKSDEFKGNLL